MESFDDAQAKFDDILNSPSIEAACAKIKSLAKAKELDSSLIFLINSAWTSAKDSPTIKNEVKILAFYIQTGLFNMNLKDFLLSKVKAIIYELYKATKSSFKSIAPKEIKVLKYLLNFMGPEERFSALGTAFSLGKDSEGKDPNVIYM